MTGQRSAGAEVYLLDLAGVLFDFDHPHRLFELGQLLQRPAEDVDALLWDSGFSADCDAGRFSDAATVRAEIRRITGYAGADEALDTAWCSAFRPAADVVAVAGSLPMTTGVFTNNGPLEEEVLTTRYAHIFDRMTHRFFCHRLVANKPDPAVYRQVGELLDTTPDRIRFVDDSEPNIDAAREAGWRATLFVNPADITTLIDQ